MNEVNRLGRQEARERYDSWWEDRDSEFIDSLKLLESESQRLEYKCWLGAWDIDDWFRYFLRKNRCNLLISERDKALINFLHNKRNICAGEKKQIDDKIYSGNWLQALQSVDRKLG